MTTAPTFLVRCPDCLVLHPWRQAPRSALPIERVESHVCPHGQPCGVRLCGHGRPMGDVSCMCTGQSGCQECTEVRAKFVAERNQRARENPREASAARLRMAGTCSTCREVERRVREEERSLGKNKEIVSTWCICVTTRKDGKDTLFIPPPFGCPHKSGERPPPWCAGATETERKLFLGALPEPMRAGALEEARKANRQEGAVQRREVVKVKRGKEDKQRSLF